MRLFRAVSHQFRQQVSLFDKRMLLLERSDRLSSCSEHRDENALGCWRLLVVNPLIYVKSRNELLSETWITPPPLLPSLSARKSSGSPIALPYRVKSGKEKNIMKKKKKRFKQLIRKYENVFIIWQCKHLFDTNSDLPFWRKFNINNINFARGEREKIWSK